jgi:hypothetical protein
MRRSYVGDVSLFGTLAYEDLVPADVKRLRHLRGVVFTDKLRLSYVKNGRIEPTEADYTWLYTFQNGVYFKPKSVVVNTIDLDPYPFGMGTYFCDFRERLPLAHGRAETFATLGSLWGSWKEVHQ